MIDHPDQVPLLAKLSVAAGHAPLVFLKVDTGYHRAGVEPDSLICDALVDALLSSEAAGHCTLHGLYSHASHSYGLREDWRAMELLAVEFTGVRRVAVKVRSKSPGHRLVLSVGATPTATTVQHPDLGSNAGSGEGAGSAPTAALNELFAGMKTDGLEMEVHAGVYPTLDLQQLATHARDSSLMTHEDIAFDVLVEVASLYPGRGVNGTAEALVTAGCLALGREPVIDKGPVPGREYSGWGIVSPWNSNNVVPGVHFPRVHGGWQVGRISQEHGILVWKGEKADLVPLEVGQRLRIWPNHSCISGAGFDHYLVVDSRNKGKEDEIVDVWARWRGW
jgi:D-serine deaminase-like pyridoxal phosphate-dependent protein